MGVDDAVVVARLDLLVQEVPGEEAQGEAAFFVVRAEELDGVDDLGGGDVDVDGAEVGGEAVADEDAAEVEEEPEFFVGDLEGEEGVRGAVGVEVPGVEARVLR